MAKVILTNEVSGLGSAGDVVEVKNGFARNYLVPQGLAVGWTRGGEKQVDAIKAGRAAREHATIEEAQDLRARLEANPVTLSAKAGAEGRLFGSIQTKDIAEAVESAGHGSLDKRVIEIPTPIRSVGDHKAVARLRDEIVATITLKVVAAK
ncbi:LSU ribosomal protein L9P [Agrococcus baldri]|uniref:Large ribosomal subunit protein bL9 n=1 Tax=Agrococcus baldri TaxID=153730 RepID=A0AA94HMM8_9MICO|nr:50S ribosomal protein L9 [Agrococcus baldri]SFS10572.1 LSU ribosomal protein L9P [Agrococcus baldri]